MLGPQQINKKLYNAEDWEFSKHKEVFVKQWLKAYQLPEEMKGIFANLGSKQVIQHIARVYEHYKSEGLEEINTLTVQAELQHFIGERIDPGEAVIEGAGELYKWTKEHMAKLKVKMEKLKDAEEKEKE